MSTRRLKLAAAALPLALALTACGGDGDRPSKDDIADAIKSGEFAEIPDDAVAALDDDAIDCIAETLHDSDLSDGALQAIVEGDEDYEPSSKDEKALETIPNELIECAGFGDMEMPDIDESDLPEMEETP